MGWLSRVPLTLKAAQAPVQKVFACKPDALDAVMAFQDSLELHQLTHLLAHSVPVKRVPGRPTKEAEPTPVQGYQLRATLERKANTEEPFSRQRSRFILATNQLDKTLWSAQKLLQEYKAQQTVERGFRFLKDPLLFVSSVFVKKPQGVEALALIMDPHLDGLHPGRTQAASDPRRPKPDGVRPTQTAYC